MQSRIVVVALPDRSNHGTLDNWFGQQRSSDFVDRFRRKFAL